MNDTTPPPDFLYVDTSSALRDLVSRLKDAQEIALDTEADSLHHYFEKVCLIQLSIADESAIVDPLCHVDLSPLLDLLAGKPLVLHGADYDLRMMRLTFGFAPEGDVFDTMLAARLLGRDNLGLASLVEEFFGVRLGKDGQKSDWSRRPLSASQLRYANHDTCYLLPLAQRLRHDLRRLGRMEWHREACASMVIQASQENTKDPDAVWRIKGSAAMTRPELNFLKATFHWRDQEAQGADRPPFHILGNRELIDLTLKVAADPEGALRAGLKLPRNCRGKRLQALTEALRAAAETPESQWPEHKRKERAQRPPRGVLEALRGECDRLAEELGIVSSTLSPRPALENIARQKPGTLEEIMTCGPLLRWQARLLEPSIRRILKGSRAKQKRRR